MKRALRDAPELVIENEDISNAWRLALKNLLEINTVAALPRCIIGLDFSTNLWD